MDSLLASALLLFLNTSYTAAQEGTCITNLPPFTNQEMQQTPPLPVGIQALVPSYRFTCNARILRWGVAIHGGRGGHGIYLQVWRPAMQEGRNQLYELVSSNYFFIEPLVGEKLIYLVPGKRWRLQVNSGDIVGFYLEDNPAITDDFHLQYQQSETASMVLYSYAEAPYSTVETADDMFRLINIAPTIKVQLDSEPAQTSNSSPEVTSQATPTTATITTDKPTTATMTTDIPTTTTTMATDTPTTATTTDPPTTTMAPASTPPRSETTLPHATQQSTTASTTNPTTDSTTPPTTPPNIQKEVAILISCLVVGGVCLSVLLLMLVLGVCLQKRQRQQKGPMPSPSSEQDSTWNLSDTLLTENHAYDHTHTGLIASWDWLPKYAKTKFRIWRALDYERPIRTCPTPSKATHKLEKSHNQYECPAPFLQSVHHYEEITVPATPTTITPTKTTPTNSP